jgi:hypothetical protein
MLMKLRPEEEEDDGQEDAIPVDEVDVGGAVHRMRCITTRRLK